MAVIGLSEDFYFEENLKVKSRSTTEQSVIMDHFIITVRYENNFPGIELHLETL